MAECGPRAHIVGEPPEVGDELTGWVPGESKSSRGRLDAMVWLGYHYGVVVMPPADVKGRERIQRRWTGPLPGGRQGGWLPDIRQVRCRRQSSGRRRPPRCL
jgi:hypothetical protein